MAACPVCGGRVPLGGGKTVRNAGELMDTLDKVRARGIEASYLGRGYDEGEWLHKYGHRDPSIANLARGSVMPHFEAAGQILRSAKADLARG